MKVLLFFTFLLATWHGYSISKPLVISPSANIINASEFIKLSAKDYQHLTGRKMHFSDRIAFSLMKARMRHDLKKNPDLLITDYVSDKKDTKFKFNILWFLIGLVLGPIGVLLAYASKQKKRQVTSAWLGFGLYTIVLIILLIAALGAISSIHGCNYPI